jgi:ABC-type branched-subunit amino acid transport system permease subunit
MALCLVLCLGVALTLLLRERYHQRVLQLTMAWAIMGLAWNIISGYAGQISFGHQVFFGLGAYTTVLLMVYWHITPWLGLLASLLVGVVAAVLIGLPTFRLAGIYFALATLAYPLTLQIIMDFLGYQEVSTASSARGWAIIYAPSRKTSRRQRLWGWTSFATRCSPTSSVRSPPQPWGDCSCTPFCSSPPRQTRSEYSSSSRP